MSSAQSARNVSRCKCSMADESLDNHAKKHIQLPELLTPCCTCGIETTSKWNASLEVSCSLATLPSWIPWFPSPYSLFSDEAKLKNIVSTMLCNDGMQELEQIPQDQPLFLQLQQMLTDTHKPSNNWTRDRGCGVHGRHSTHCSMLCVFQNKAPVPKGYLLRRAFRNHNAQLWEQYCQTQMALFCDFIKDSSHGFTFVPALSNLDLDSKLNPSCNEWRLLHGTTQASACAICSSNFQPASR